MSELLKLISQHRNLLLDTPKLMGILNMTPDSFSDGGKFIQFNDGLSHARSMLASGVDWIDIGGESSGPESTGISLDEELSRVVPIINAIREESDVWLSIDTWKSRVAIEAVNAGVDCINDVTSLRGDIEMAQTVSDLKCALVLMYSKDDTARTSIRKVEYDDVIKTLQDFFIKRLEFALSMKIHNKSIILDPGLGHFVSANPQYSFEILKRSKELINLGYPLMVGPSRKSFLSDVSEGSQLGIAERDFPCAAASSIALWQGVKILRMHEVKQGRQILDTIRHITLTNVEKN